MVEAEKEMKNLRANNLEVKMKKKMRKKRKKKALIREPQEDKKYNKNH